jgi:hypothetical protein
MRRRPEQQIHRAIAKHLEMRALPGVVLPHPANGGGRTAVEGAILKGLGVQRGAPDLLLWRDGKSFALEIKADDGRVSPAQTEMPDRLAKAGVVTAVCHGLDPALATLEGWQPRAEAADRSAQLSKSVTPS